MHRIIRSFLLPFVFYLSFLLLITYPAGLSFFNRLFSDTNDGFTCVWTLWWVRHAVTVLHAPIWLCSSLFFPAGITLLGHTLSPINGWTAIPLVPLLGFIPSYNLLLAASFVLSGCAAFWLAREITGSYPAALAAGYLFTFSAFHFAHAEGHLSLSTLQFLPVFLLLWHRWLKCPGPWPALAAAAALYAVLLSDLSFALDAVLGAAVLAAFRGLKLKDAFFMFRESHRGSLALFSVTVLLSTGIIALAFFKAAVGDPFVMNADLESFSMDLFEPLIPGSHWKFSGLTSGYWGSLAGFSNEHAAYLGWAAAAMLVWVWIRRSTIDREGRMDAWFGLLILFGLLALGPQVHIGLWGVKAPNIFYSASRTLMPALAYVRNPGRFSVMVSLAASVICAFGLSRMWSRTSKRRGTAIAAVWCALLFVETLPSPIMLTEIKLPPYVRFLRTVESDGSVFEPDLPPATGLLYQTVHERPLALGHVSHLPKSRLVQKRELIDAYVCGRFDELGQRYGVRYLVLDRARHLDSPGLEYPVVYSDADVTIYDLSSNKPL